MIKTSATKLKKATDKTDQTPIMEFKNVVFNAARDGKLRRLKVKVCQKSVDGNMAKMNLQT